MTRLKCNSKIILFAIMLLHTIICKSQTYSKLINDKDIIEFMQWKLFADTTPNMEVPKEYFSFSTNISKWFPITLKWDSNQDSSTNNHYCIFNKRRKWLDTIFSIKDREFLIQQNDLKVDSIWHLPYPKTLAAKEGFKHYCSLPLFSINKQYAILLEVYLCGSMCGETNITLYKHTKEGWAVFRGISGAVF